MVKNAKIDYRSRFDLRKKGHRKHYTNFLLPRCYRFDEFVMESSLISSSEIPYIDIAIHEETLSVDVTKVIELLRPDWKIDHLVFECKSDGYVNRNYHCHMGDGKDGLFVRLVSTKLKEDFRDGAIRFMTYLRRRGMGAKLLCTFTNGLVMEYLKGEPITWPGFRRIKEERNWSGVAQELARYHGTTNMDDIRELGIKTYKQRLNEFGAQVKATLESGIIPKEYLEGLPSVDELQQLMSQIYTQLENMNAELCFCHGDPNPTNFIITDQGPMLVDYDTSALDFAACNIAYFFLLNFDAADIKFDDQPTEVEKDIFIREYLEQRRRIHPTRGPVTEKQVCYWKYLVRQGDILNILYFVGAALFVHELDKTIDLKTSQVFWNMFAIKKHVLEEKFLNE